MSTTAAKGERMLMACLADIRPRIRSCATFTTAPSMHESWTEGHRKMMDALSCLDNYGLQLICESVQALSRELTPVRAPQGYLMPQVSGTPLAHEFYRAASNLGTAIVVPLLASTQQPLAEAPIRHPDPEIEAAVINMEHHEQASRDNNNNPW